MLSLIVTQKELTIMQQNATIGFAHRENAHESQMNKNAPIESNESNMHKNA